MKQNVIFWCAVNNPEHSDKYGAFEWFEYSKKSWQYWCKKHNIIFYEYNMIYYYKYLIIAINS